MTVVFWTDGRDAEAEAAERFLSHWLDDHKDVPCDSASQLWSQAPSLAASASLADLDAHLESDVRVNVLGLSPNMARLSVRLWVSEPLGTIVEHWARHCSDLHIDPLPWGWGTSPSVDRLLINTLAASRERRNIPPALAADLLRSALKGTKYPLSLVSTALMRLRAGGNAGSGWHAALIRAVLTRSRRVDPMVPGTDEIPSRLDRCYPGRGYQLGRLFAAYEWLQRQVRRMAWGANQDGYFPTASAAPATIFPLLITRGEIYLAALRGSHPEMAKIAIAEINDIKDPIIERHRTKWLEPLSLCAQGEFVIGYYQQISAQNEVSKSMREQTSIADEATGEGAWE